MGSSLVAQPHSSNIELTPLKAAGPARRRKLSMVNMVTTMVEINTSV
jgi:hypothetical protein